MKFLRKSHLKVGFWAIAALFGLLVVSTAWRNFGQKTRARSRLRVAYNIHQALTHYGSTHEGLLPPAGEWSNDVFRELFRTGIMDGEGLFFVKGSPWCEGELPENPGSEASGYAEAVSAGENHWACLTGVNLSAPEMQNLPLLMDAYTAEFALGNESRRNEWFGKHGRYDVVITVKGAGRAYELTDKDLKAVFAPMVDLFPSGLKLLLPQPPKGGLLPVGDWIEAVGY